MRTLSLPPWSLALLMSVAAFSASAQDIPSAAEEAREGEEIKGNTRVAEIREVERGFFLGVDAGPNYYLGLTSLQPVRNLGLFAPVNETWLQPGAKLGLRLGFDILNNINIEGFLIANFNRGVVKPELIRQGQLTGDIAHFAPGVSARFAFVTTERLFIYARLGLGLAFWFPPQLATGSITGFFLDDFALGIHSEASLGIEYYTLLRHISVGFEVAVQGAYLPFAFGVMAYPTIKYTF